MEIIAGLFAVCVIGVLAGNDIWFWVIAPVARRVQIALTPEIETDGAAVLDRSDRQVPPDVFIINEDDPKSIHKVKIEK